MIEFTQVNPEPEDKPVSTTPDWWPESKAPEILKTGWLCPANDGTWRRKDGSLVNRAERRKAGVK